MKRGLIASLFAAAWLGLASTSSAQVFVRAPFVRVGVGQGVYVRAPFVNLYIPDGPVYGPQVMALPPGTTPPPSIPAPQRLPIPNPPTAAAQAPRLDVFAKSFQAKAGTFDTAILNPLTNQPTSVRFTLPAGTPRRVITTRRSIEWFYAPRSWVRIDFDRDGATVTAR